MSIHRYLVEFEVDDVRVAQERGLPNLDAVPEHLRSEVQNALHFAFLYVDITVTDVTAAMNRSQTP